MAFTTQPLAAPAPAPAVNAQQDSRQRAISALMGGNATPPVDANSIAPEEMGAVKAPSESAAEAPSTGQIDKAEAPSEAPKEPASSQFAHLAKKEKAIRAAVVDLKRQQAAFKAEQDAAKASTASTPAAPAFDSTKYIDKDTLKQNTWEVLRDLGVTYDQLTQQALNSPDPAVTAEIKNLRAQVEREVKSLREEQEKARKGVEDQQTAAYQQAIAQIKADAKRLVDADPAFELIKATESVNDVADLIERTFKEEKRLMTVEEAAQEVEAYLTEEATRLARLGKIQKLLKPAIEAPAAQPAGKAPQGPSKTLTNALGAQRPMTMRERAIAAMQGKK